MSNWRSDWRQRWRMDWRGIGGSENLPPQGPATVASFALDLEQGYRVKLSWITNAIPTRSGLEQRIARNTRAKESYEGSAWLLGDMPRNVRTTLAKYAARGAVFSLALPHEELLVTDVSGSTLSVSADELALTDWARPGQRVSVYQEDDEGLLEFVEAVIQSVGTSTIQTDVATGLSAGARIAPAKAIYFEPQQDFGRFEVDAELWDVRARAVDFDFAFALASLALGPITGSGALDGVTIVSRLPGLAGNDLTFELFNGGPLLAGQLVESDGDVSFAFWGGNSTVGDLRAALESSGYVAMTGTWNDADLLMNADALSPTALTGGEAEGLVGTGATLEEHDDKPVWDWPIRLVGSTKDSLHALTEIIDLGGVPYAKGFADVADWGRAVAMRSSDRYDWQWFKLFLTTVRGRQKSWWLPTYRDDLPFVSKAAGTVTVQGDIGVWYPTQRQHIQVVETDGTVTRAEITAAMDNGDGTWTLTIGTTLATADVEMVSWLELCRFERDEIDVEFTEHGFQFATVARVVQA